MLTKREALHAAAALRWLEQCVKSGEPYDMSHLRFDDEPLTDAEAGKLIRRIERTIALEDLAESVQVDKTSCDDASCMVTGYVDNETLKALKLF